MSVSPDSAVRTSLPRPAHRRALLAAWKASVDPTCLALVIGARGSSYRKPGALALLDEQGFLAGTLSGGCMDEDIATAARDCLRNGRARLLQLDTASQEDLLFGSQSGCRGEIDIMLWPSAAARPHPLLEALERAEAGHQTLCLRVLRAGPEAGRLLIESAPPQPAAVGIGVKHEGSEAAAHWSTLRLPPTPRLLLIGGGPEAPPLLHIGLRCGWWMEVIEHRGRFLPDLAAADRVHPGRAVDWLPQLTLDRYDAAICMSHLYADDLAALRLLAASPLAWIGVLGPRARLQALLTELAGVAQQLHGRIEGPVGEALGGDGPEALALSIAARLQRLFARR
jgi:xanthine dehydrogenase accessory factor